MRSFSNRLVIHLLCLLGLSAEIVDVQMMNVTPETIAEARKTLRRLEEEVAAVNFRVNVVRSSPEPPNQKFATVCHWTSVALCFLRLI